jgi:hypothetical protein
MDCRIKFGNDDMEHSPTLPRHCEEPTGPARSGRPDDRLHDEAIQRPAQAAGLLR